MFKHPTVEIIRHWPLDSFGNRLSWRECHVTAGSTCQPSPLPSLSFLPFLSLFSPPLLAPEPAAPRRPPLPPHTCRHASCQAATIVIHPCASCCSWLRPPMSSSLLMGLCLCTVVVGLRTASPSLHTTGKEAGAHPHRNAASRECRGAGVEHHYWPVRFAESTTCRRKHQPWGANPRRSHTFATGHCHQIAIGASS